MAGKLIISICIALSGLPQLAPGQIAFQAAQNYPVGTAPLAVAAGDFNNDGKLDLAVANSGNGSADEGGISILLGNGDGTFQSATNVSAGRNPQSIASVDLNGDGKGDLIVTNSDGAVGQVGVLLGNGDGTFRPVVDYGAGNGPIAIAAADFNGDLRPDVVVANPLDGTVSILLGNGDGTLQAHVDYAARGFANDIVVADLNGDGRPDLALAAGSNVAILIGNADGTFQPAVPYNTGARFGATAIAAGDFNSDGKPDLIVDDLVSVSLDPPSATRRLDLLEGRGDGTFQLINGAVASVGSAFLSAADFDGDGKLDLALNGLVFLPANGDGTFQAPVGFPVTPSGVLFTADLNQDKAPDLLIVDQVNNLVSVVLNVGTDFSMAASAASPAIIGPGQSTTSTLSLSLLNSFNNPVSLSCSVQPAPAGAPSCSITPGSLTFDGSGKATAQLTLTAGTSAASLTPPSAHPASQPWNSLWLPLAGLAFAGVGLPRDSSRRKTWVHFLAGSFLLVGLILPAACGGGSGHTGPTNITYNATVTAASGTTQRSVTVHFMVR